MVFSLLSLLPMSAFLYMELCTIAAYGWGWMRAWNVLDMVRVGVTDMAFESIAGAAVALGRAASGFRPSCGSLNTANLWVNTTRQH
jgi:hypothetical protein